MSEPTPRMFPIMQGPSIPWAVLSPFEKQAWRNHGQTLQRLADRGGLGANEALAIIEGRPWTNAKWCAEDNVKLAAFVRDHYYLVRNDELERTLAAQLAELNRISDALGTNEGHSSVDHILAMKAKIDAQRTALDRANEERTREMTECPYCHKHEGGGFTPCFLHGGGPQFKVEKLPDGMFQFVCPVCGVESGKIRYIRTALLTLSERIRREGMQGVANEIEEIVK